MLKKKKKAALNIKSCGTHLILKHPSGHEHRNVSLVHYSTMCTLKLFCIHLSKINTWMNFKQLTTKKLIVCRISFTWQYNVITGNISDEERKTWRTLKLSEPLWNAFLHPDTQDGAITLLPTYLFSIEITAEKWPHREYRGNTLLVDLGAIITHWPLVHLNSPHPHQKEKKKGGDGGGRKICG